MVEPIPTDRLMIVVGDGAGAAEIHAAQELQKYVRTLYAFTPSIVGDHSTTFTGRTVLVGNPANNALVDRVAGDLDWGSLSADGFFLKSVGADPDVVVVGGGRGRGTLFGVYELIERWGVRFTLTEDIIPEKPGHLSLTGFDEKCEPAYPIRAMRPLNNLPEGSAAWDLSDVGCFIDQMAKLKYNAYGFAIMESGPVLDYEFRGVRRPAGDLCYGWRYPIDDESIGKELFEGRVEFYNPILGKARDEEDRRQLGIGMVRSIIEHCKRRDLMSVLTFALLEPPTVFKHRFNDWASLPLPDPKDFPNAHFLATPLEEFGTNPEYAAWMNVKDPVVRELIALRVKALIDTYPQADYYYLWISEHRAGVVDYREIFNELDSKYHFSPEFDLDREIGNPRGFAYGIERYQHQMKGDILFLYLFDKIFNEDHLLDDTNKPHARIALAGIMPELAPLAVKILPPGAMLAEWLEYGVHATADRIGDLVPVLDAGIATTLEIGIQDDNTMWFPQINVESLERIVQPTAPMQMKGYVTALWQIRQADINGAYLGRASWQPDLSPADFYQDYLPKMVGREAAPVFRQALHVIEEADMEVKKSLYGFAFAFEGAMEGKLDGVDRDAVDRIRPRFKEAMEHLVRARENATDYGKTHVDFWLKRTLFGIQWLDLGASAADLGQLIGEGRPSGTGISAQQKQMALAGVDRLLTDARTLIQIIVDDCRHIGDLGQIASLNRYVYSYLKELRADLAGRPEV